MMHTKNQERVKEPGDLPIRVKSCKKRMLRNFKKLFISFYEKWKSQAKAAKKSLTAELPNEILQEIIDGITNSSSGLRRIYEELLQHITPDNDTRRRTCASQSQIQLWSH